MPTFLFHRMRQILLRPAILGVSAQQSSLKRNVGKALPVMNGIGMAGECLQENENNAQTKAKNAPKRIAGLQAHKTARRLVLGEGSVSMEPVEEDVGILSLISSLHVDMRRSE